MQTVTALMCLCFTDEGYARRRWGAAAAAAPADTSGARRIWNNDALPNAGYVEHCLAAAAKLSQEAVISFLDDSVLGDRKTTLRQYCAAHPRLGLLPFLRAAAVPLSLASI